MTTPTFTGDETVSDILLLMPEAAEILSGYGLACVSCHINAFETLRQGMSLHGMDEEDLTLILADLNEAAEELKITPDSISADPVVTAHAKKKIKQFQAEEDMEGWGFKIDIMPAEGGQITYFLDFLERPEKGDVTVESRGVKLFLSSESYRHLRGCAVDFSDREGGFKIERRLV